MTFIGILLPTFLLALYWSSAQGQDYGAMQQEQMQQQMMQQQMQEQQMYQQQMQQQQMQQQQMQQQIVIIPACYCRPAVCNKCFLEPGYPYLVQDNFKRQDTVADYVPTKCDHSIPCLAQPKCRRCTPRDLRFESCIYYAPGINTCYTGRTGFFGRR